MKKVLLFTSLFLILAFASCSKDDDEKYCWKFTVKQTTTVSPVISGYPKTITSTSTQCDLTESEADEVVKKLSTTTSSSSQGYTVTVKTTVTKTRTDKKENTEKKEAGGERVPTGRD